MDEKNFSTPEIDEEFSSSSNGFEDKTNISEPKVEHPQNTTHSLNDEDEGIDIMAMVRNLWDGRKTIIICTVIFIVLGVLAAINMKRTYTVSTVMVPQLGNSNKSGLGGLASLAGIDMGFNANNGELTPLAYPQIVSSVPFRLNLMHTPLHFDKCDTLISMFDYVEAGYEKPTVLDYVKKYTIGLPGVIMSALKGEEPEVVYYDAASANDSTPRPLAISMKEYKMQKAFEQIVTLDVDKKEGFITLNVTGSEPLMTAELAMKAQQLLQDEVTRFRIEKSQSELDYIQARFNEIKAENDRNQMSLAVATDRTQNVATTSAQIGKQRMQSKYNVSNAVFVELAKQLEQAKMQVKKDTPVFTIIQPVTIPNKAANSRAKKVVIWTFLGFVLGCGIVICKGYWPTLKEKLAKPAEEPLK